MNNNYGYVDPIKAHKTIQKNLDENLEFLKEQIDSRDFDLEEFNEIIKDIRKNYTEDTEEISFVLLLMMNSAKMYFNIDKYSFAIYSEYLGCEVYEKIHNAEAHKKLYNQLLDFCK